MASGLPSTIQPPLPQGATSEEMQYNGECWMPAYDSKVVVERTPKKILQELEKRLLFPMALDLDVEIASLNELQSAMLGKDKMEGYRYTFSVYILYILKYFINKRVYTTHILVVINFELILSAGINQGSV